MKFIDMFAGIGGFRRGMELAGHECVGFVEFDKYATASYTSMHLITPEQREFLKTLDLRKRREEILKDEYRNGEWYVPDIREVTGNSIPKSDCWCFGAPCQDFSVAGKRAGLEGDRSSLIREVFRILGEIREEDRPEWLIYENVKGMLSSNRGFDFLAILTEMDFWGYDIEWCVLNSKHFGVPQNRERVFTLGHLRSRGRRKVFPVGGTTKEDSVEIKVIGKVNSSQDGMIVHPNSISKTHTAGHNNQSNVAIKVIGTTKPHRHSTSDIHSESGVMSTITGRDWKEPKMVSIQTGVPTGIQISGHKIGDLKTIANTLNANDQRKIFGANQERTMVAVPTGIDKSSEVATIWYPKEECYIAVRKFTPRECFRLQGWSDDYFEKAEFVNSNSQLYKQAGNGVTVNVVYEIARRLRKETE